MNPALESLPKRLLNAPDSVWLACDQRLHDWSDGWRLGQGAFLLSPSGEGKSLAVVRALLRLYSGATPPAAVVRWYRADQLASARQRWPLGQGEPREVELAMSSRVVIIDNLGTERDPGLLVEIAQARYDADLRTVVTSAHPFSAIRRRYGDSFARRIVDNEEDRVIDLFPKDLAS